MIRRSSLRWTAGGAFGLLVRDRNASNQDGAPKLADIRWFKRELEENASLALRRDDIDVVDLYDEHGRVVGGDHDDELDATDRAWQTDTAAGRSSILIAETSDSEAEREKWSSIAKLAAEYETIGEAAQRQRFANGRRRQRARYRPRSVSRGR